MNCVQHVNIYIFIKNGNYSLSIGGGAIRQKVDGQDKIGFVHDTHICMANDE